ncbi:MAG: hypothetical protein AAF499_04215 [Pseudomonadota bacterium]
MSSVLRGLAVMGFSASMVFAQDKPKVLIIYDSSNSMWGELADGSRKYQAGRAALGSILGQGLGGREIGFRAYGHRRKDDCRDSELVAPFADEALAGPAILDAANAFNPKGKTPITYSLTEGLKDFSGGAGEILLVSDGVETCDADPCALMAAWQDQDVEVRVHVVGVGLNDLERTAMSCIADTSGGRYFDVDSAEGFVSALKDAGETITENAAEEPPVVGEPDPEPDERGYAIVYRAVDAMGRNYPDAEGRLYRDGALVDGALVAKGRGRNTVEGPGSYTMEVGVLLRDGSLFEPQQVPVEVIEPGDTVVDVRVKAPARVNAVFTENGEAHPGALVSAFQDDQEVFRFRAQDTALARPGDYVFRTRINDDNQLETAATLVAAEETTVAFELVQTVRVYITFRLPDGTEMSRNSTLWVGGQQAYSVHSGNGADVKPGTYQVQSDDQNLPLGPTDITIGTERGRRYELPLPSGWVTIQYADEPENYFKGRVPTRAQLHSIDRGNWSHSSPGRSIPVAPGNYSVAAFDKDGAIAPVEVVVANNKRVEVTLVPTPLGELLVTYAPSENYLKKPDRAFAEALEGQPLVNSFLRPGEAAKFVPGRYRVNGRANAGPIASQEVVVVAGQQTVVELSLKAGP